MTATLASTLDGVGFVFLRAFMTGAPTLEALSRLGPITRLAGFGELQELRPRRIADTTPNTYSGNFGWAPFPLHTDLAHWSVPPRYFALRCVEGAEAVKTRLVDGMALIREFGELRLRRALVRPRRPIQRTRGLLRVLDRPSGGTLRLRWDTLFLLPATAESSETCTAISACLSACALAEVSLSQPGDTLIVDNWRVLHGRSNVPGSATNRVVHRAYLGDVS